MGAYHGFDQGSKWEPVVLGAAIFAVFVIWLWSLSR